MTKAIIKVSGCLIILNALDDFHPINARLDGLPSWSPDYSNITAVTAWDSQPQHFQLNPNPTYFRFSQHGQVLHVRGVRIGTVKDTWCTAQITIPRGYYPDHMPFDFTQLRVTQCSKALNVREEHLLELLTTSDEQIHKRLAAATDTLTGAVHIKATCSAGNCDLINKQWGEGNIFMLDETNNASYALGSQRPAFFTQPLGIANKLVMAGDDVYVFEGAHRYMTLRKYGAYHQIVCSGSLHGEDTSFIWTIDRLHGCTVEDITIL
jgi:hypothetical protein